MMAATGKGAESKMRKGKDKIWPWLEIYEVIDHGAREVLDRYSRLALPHQKHSDCVLI